MIKCNLAVLLAERGLKMADVINDTPLSKTAVRGLYYNTSKGIQFDTMQILCDYLKVGPQDLIKLVEFDYFIIGTKADIEKLTIHFIILFKFNDRQITDSIKISLVSPTKNELYETKKISDITINFQHSDELQKNILSQITDTEYERLQSNLIDEFINTFDLRDYLFTTIHISYNP